MTKLLLLNIACTFEWNLDSIADGKSYWFQGNENSKASDWLCLKKNSPRNFANATITETDAKSIDIIWTMQRYALNPDVLKVKNSKSYRNAVGFQEVIHAKAFHIPLPCWYLKWVTDNFSALLLFNKQQCLSSQSKHLNIDILWKSTPGLFS